MNIKVITLSYETQTQKNKYYMFTLYTDPNT